MQLCRHRSNTIRTLLLLTVFAATAVRALPAATISYRQFETYIQQWSEPEGYFDTDNFISNETSYLHVIDDLHRRVRPGGVYIGVGPDQNFSYIAQTRPSLAIIIDIRRQNMLEHLFYKALFDRASSRADYVALLFSREKPVVPVSASLETILNAVRSAPTSEALFNRNLAAVRNILTSKYGLKLSTDDLGKIEYVYRTFWQENLDLRFSSIGRLNAQNYPTFETMLLETDREGRHQSYLATEELFQWLKQFEDENRLIPIVGDFAGTHAFNTVAQFLKVSGLQVSTFYTSNVEFYLFGQPAWRAFMKNVHALPVAADGVFIRSYFSNGRVHPLNVAGHRSTSMVHAIVPFLRDYDAGRLQTYWDVVDRSN
jgi:hypothetical protein